MKQQESVEQQAVVTWFRAQYPKLKGRLFAIPNGGHRDKKTIYRKGVPITYSPTAKRLKDEGVLPGVLDLFLTIPKGRYHGAFIEMKWGNNDVSDNQQAFIEEHKEDYYCCVCWSFEEAATEIRNYLSQQ